MAKIKPNPGNADKLKAVQSSLAKKKPGKPTKPEDVITDDFLARIKAELQTLTAATGNRTVPLAGGVMGEQIGMVNDHRVMGVKTRDVMEASDTLGHSAQEFSTAGNPQKYPWMDKDTYWVEFSSPLDELDHNLVHEASEEGLMAELGWDYDKAHEAALGYEMDYLKEADNANGNEGGQAVPSPQAGGQGFGNGGAYSPGQNGP